MLTTNEFLNDESIKELSDVITHSTGIPFYTIDYQGKIVENPENLPIFVQAVEESPLSKQRAICDAQGAIHAAADEKPYIFPGFCGVVKAAVPITNHDEYFGSVIAGPVVLSDRDDEATPEMSDDEQALLKSHPEEREAVPKVKQTDLLSVTQLLQIMLSQIIALKQDVVDEKAKYQSSEQVIERQFRQLEAYKRKELLPHKEHLVDQLNMHFWFNALTSAANLSIIEGAMKTNEMITLIATFLRNTLLKREGLWTMKEEVTSVESYLRIQTVRFGERIRYKIDVPRRMMDLSLPKMLLLPFVEYATADVTSEAAGGTLLVKASREDDEIEFLIEDSGTRQQNGASSTFFSLEDNITLVKERLSREFGTGYHIINEKENGLNRCIICIPTQENANV